MSGAGEFDFIHAELAPLSAKAPGAANLTDDGATLQLSDGHELAVTVDALIEGRHFPIDEDPALATRKALRANLSDLASMGAEPLGYLTSVIWPEKGREHRAAGFVAGLTTDQALYDIALMGGDTTASDGPWSLSITALGQVPFGQALRRGSARIGDQVWVSGTIGDAWLGLQHRIGRLSLDPNPAAYLAERFTLPEPRLELGRHLRGCANACADVSDGLMADLNHIAEASRVCIELDLALMPISDAGTAWLKQQTDEAEARLALASGGDDYELVFTAAPEQEQDVVKQAHETGVRVTRVGWVIARDKFGETLRVSCAGQAMRPNRLGFTHF